MAAAPEPDPAGTPADVRTPLDRDVILGRLARGVGHDFNNMLTAILGYADLLEGALAAGSRERRWLERIRESAQQATVLTRQLSTFVRDAPGRTARVDLNHVVTTQMRLLPRLLEEDIRLSSRLDPDVASIVADPAVVERSVVHLVLAARERMVRGGAIVLSTAGTSEGGAAITVRFRANGRVGPAAPGGFADDLERVDLALRAGGGRLEIPGDRRTAGTFRMVLPAGCPVPDRGRNR